MTELLTWDHAVQDIPDRVQKRANQHHRRNKERDEPGVLGSAVPEPVEVS